MSIVTASAASVTSVATSVVISVAATVVVVLETDCEANWGMKRAR